MKVMTYEEAVEFFRDLIPMTSAEYEALVAEVGEYAQSLAFTVSRIASADLLQDLHTEILKAIEEGKSFYEFRKGIDEIMARLGWDGLAPYRLDNIFRTNIQTAYNAGRYKQMKAVAERRPFWEYDAVNDTHTRPSHLDQDGKIYRHDHPFWNTWYPPNGYRCRCRVNSISAQEMKEEGLKEETQVTDLKPDEGFRHNPADKRWRPDPEKYHPRLRSQLEDWIWD
jgi:SPP1 gp7 family putative phage head morphogenesis protein